MIEVNLTPAAARDHAFEKLLARHQLVAFSAPPAQPSPAQPSPAQAPAAPVSGLDDASADIADSDDADSVKKDTAPAGSPPSAEKKKQLAAALAEVEGEYAAPSGDGELPALREAEVNATADQFTASSATCDLREHSDQFAEARLEFGAVRELARQVPAEQLMLNQSAAKDAAGRGVTAAEEATSAPATPTAVPPAAALPAAVTPAIRAKGQAQQPSEFKSTDGLDRQPSGAAVKKSRQQQSKAQSKQTESLADEPARSAADKENAVAKREVGDRDAADVDVDTKPAGAKDHVAKNGTIAGEAGKADEDKKAADVVGGDKPQLRAESEKLSEKGQRAKGAQPKPAASYPIPGAAKPGAAKLGTLKPGDVKPGQADTAVPGGAQPAATGGPGAVQLHSQTGGLQLNLAPAKAGVRSAQGSNQAAGALGGGGGGIGAAPAAPGTTSPPSQAVPANAGFGSAGFDGAGFDGAGFDGAGLDGAVRSTGRKRPRRQPARPAATVNNRLTRQASPTVKLIFRLHVAEPAVAAPVASEPAEPEAAAPAAEPATREAP